MGSKEQTRSEGIERADPVWMLKNHSG